MGISFILKCSNYTTQIESELVNRRFVYAMQSNSCFAAFSKIKSNVSEFAPPNIDNSKLVYFNFDFRGDQSFDAVYNIDLKSAYAAILHKYGYISRNTYAYLSRISKYDRLASVGMLASKQQIFYFNKNGQIYLHESKISDKEDFFYFAVQKVFEVMQELRRLCGHSYLFTWVDGIYFTPDRDALFACEEYLRKQKLRYSEDILRNWSVRRKGNGICLSFLKEDKKKMFNLPSKQSEFQKLIGETMSIIYNNKKQNYDLSKSSFSGKQS